MSSSFISVSKPVESHAATGIRVWLFRLLVLAGAGLFVASWVIPWWRSNIQESGLFVQIRPWGLEHNLGNYVMYMGGDPGMPGFFAPLMWAYMVVALVVLLVSIFLRERTLRVSKFTWSLPQVLVTLVGISYIIFVLVFLVYAYLRINSFGVLFVGESYIVIPEFELGASALSDFEQGFRLACVAGPLFLVLGILRNKIIGQSSLTT